MGVQPLSDACTEGGLPDPGRARDEHESATPVRHSAPVLADHVQRLSSAGECSPGEMGEKARERELLVVAVGGGRELEVGGVGEDRLLEPSQLRARLEPHLVGEQAGTLAVGRECVDVAPGSVEREHELRAEALVQGMFPR